MTSVYLLFVSLEVSVALDHTKWQAGIVYVSSGRGISL
jgi:hypothetical protein